MSKVIDLFSGVGGFSLGFSQAGFLITKAVEFDEEIARSYKTNHANTLMYNNDISHIDNSDFFENGEADVIIGGPPCQGFSMAGARIRGDFINDPRNQLFKNYLNIVSIVSPKIFVFENVKGILTLEDGKVFSEIINSFEDPDNFSGDKYNLFYRVLNSNQFGIPQSRERVIIFGIKNKIIDLDTLLKLAKDRIYLEDPDFFNEVNVWDAISDLECLPEKEKVKKVGYLSDYQRRLGNDSVYISNHVMTNHSKIAVERMKLIKPGENYMSLDENINSVHSGAYGRLEKKDLSPTITTRFDTPSGGKFIHPVHNRTLTPREAARIQSFPDSFLFFGSKSSISRQIGNAVPPKLAYYLATVVKEILNDW